MNDQHHRMITQSPGKMPKVRVFADKVDEMKEQMGGMEDMIEPVDLNGGYTGMGKKPDNLEQSEDNIRWRFDLDPSKIQRTKTSD